MEEPNTTEKILKALEEKNVTPRPRAYFLLRNSILWIPGIVTTLLGAYTVAGIIYGVIHPHWERISYLVIPFLWVVSFMIFSALTLTLIRKTSNGYRYTAQQLILISITTSVLLGIVIYAFTQDALDNKVNTFYRYPTQRFYERNLPELRIN